MTTTTHANFNEKTEGREVAQAFPDSIRGRTILVTGVNLGGIGFATIQALASQSPGCLIIASRTPSKIQECIEALKKDYPTPDYRALKLDLSNQKAVRAAATELLSWSDIPKLDLVINNAAVMNIPERTLSEEGIEMHFATNHIGHFLFVNLIMPKLIKAAEGGAKGATRVINVTSLSPTVAPIRWSDINFDQINSQLPEGEQPSYQAIKLWGVSEPEKMSYVPIEGYNQSKVANLLFSIGLNRRLYEKHGILSFACHPGIILTELGRYAEDETKQAIRNLLESGRFPVKTLEGCAATTVVAALDPKLGLPVERSEDGKENIGAYFVDCQISDMARPESTSSAAADRLWGLSEDMVKEKFSW